MSAPPPEGEPSLLSTTFLLGDVGNALCRLFGTTRLFDEATMASLYIDSAGYKAAVSDAVAAGIARGTLLQLDAERIIEAAGLQWKMLTQ